MLQLVRIQNIKHFQRTGIFHYRYFTEISVHRIRNNNTPPLISDRLPEDWKTAWIGPC